MFSLLEFFTDPILIAPTIGSILMCMATALVGVILFIRKHSLLGEALTHAAYPGVVLGALVASCFIRKPGADEGIIVLIGGFVSALLGLLLIRWLQKRAKLRADSALCLILSVFFGLGVLFASRLQLTHAIWYKQIQIYLYGQAATMVNFHIVLYAILAVVTLSLIATLYRLIQWIHFDRDFTNSIGSKVIWVERIIDFLLLVSIVVGMRSVGVVLLSGMLIAPAVAARPWTHRLSLLFLIAALLGGFCGLAGNYLSLNLPQWIGKEHLILPTGPMILLTASAFSLFSLFFAPRRGLLFLFFRSQVFRSRCVGENFLKRLWREGEGKTFTTKEVMHLASSSVFHAWVLFRKMRWEGWIDKDHNGFYRLSSDGARKASRIVRLHRLWEVYLVDYLGQRKEKVHRNAEQMEHLLSPTLERELTKLLNNPKYDPHKQPIPNPDEPLLR